MQQKKIVICIGTDEAKHIRARLSLLVLEDGIVASRQYHSVNVEPGADLAKLRETVEKDLAAHWIPGSPWPAIPDAEWADVERHVEIIHKPELVAAHQAKKDEEARLAAIAQADADAAEQARAAANRAAFEQAVNDALARLGLGGNPRLKS